MKVTITASVGPVTVARIAAGTTVTKGMLDMIMKDFAAGNPPSLWVDQNTTVSDNTSEAELMIGWDTSQENPNG